MVLPRSGALLPRSGAFSCGRIVSCWHNFGITPKRYQKKEQIVNNHTYLCTCTRFNALISLYIFDVFYMFPFLLILMCFCWFVDMCFCDLIWYVFVILIYFVWCVHDFCDLETFCLMWYVYDLCFCLMCFLIWSDFYTTRYHRGWV